MKKFESAIDLMYAYAHALLDEEAPTILKLLLKNHSVYSSLSNFLDMEMAIKLLNQSLLKLEVNTN